VAAAVDADNEREVVGYDIVLLRRKIPFYLKFLLYIFLFLYILGIVYMAVFLPKLNFSLLKYINIKWIIIWTLAQAIASATLATIVGLPVGIAAGFYKLRLAMTYRSLGLPVFMAPSVAVVLGFQWAHSVGLLPDPFWRAPLGIIIIHSYFNIPLSAVMVETSLQGTLGELNEYIYSLGLPRRTLYFKVLIPLSIPGALLAWLLSFTYSFLSLSVPLMLPGSAYRYYTLEAWIYTLYYSFPSLRLLAYGLAILQALFLFTLAIILLKIHSKTRPGELGEKTWRPTPGRIEGLALSLYAIILLALLYIPIAGVFLQAYTGRHGGFSLEPLRMLLYGRIPLPPGAGLARSIANSIVYAVLTAVLAVLLSVPAVLGGSVRRAITMLPMVVSPVMAGIGLYITYYHSLESHVGQDAAVVLIIILAHTLAALPLTSRIIETGLLRLPREVRGLLVSLRIGGISLLSNLAGTIRGAVVSGLVLASIASLGEFGATLVVSTPRTWSLGVLTYYLYNSGRAVQAASVSASMLLLLSIVMVALSYRWVKEWF